MSQCSPGTKEALHYLGAIKVRLELLYEHSTQDARLLEHLSDEVDWVDAEIERLRSTDAAATTSEPIAWIVKWSTVHTPKNASAYLNEADAKRAAANVRMYAHASDVVVIPTFDR